MPSLMHISFKSEFWSETGTVKINYLNRLYQATWHHQALKFLLLLIKKKMWKLRFNWKVGLVKESISRLYSIEWLPGQHTRIFAPRWHQSPNALCHPMPKAGGELTCQSYHVINGVIFCYSCRENITWY